MYFLSQSQSEVKEDADVQKMLKIAPIFPRKLPLNSSLTQVSLTGETARLAGRSLFIV